MKNVPRLSLWIASEFQSKAKAQLKLKPLEVFYKKGVLKHFTKFPGNELRWSLFFNEGAGLPATPFKKKTPT